MKTIPSAIRRGPLKIPKPLSNPAAALIRDTIAHHGITQAEAADAMIVSKAKLSDVIRQKKQRGKIKSISVFGAVIHLIHSPRVFLIPGTRPSNRAD